ncbi:PAS domain S-box protein, partial [bacterium]|nr:PAS domain S-box protein [bacterium]
MKSSSIFLNWVLLAFLCFSGYPSAWTQEMWEPISPIQPRIDSPWLITDYLEESKLHYLHLFHIAFEPNGTAWISTGQGLYRYEGYLWRSFNKNDGLPSDFIRCVCVTKDGTVWVGTDKGAGVFENESFSPRGINTLAGPSVRRIVEDVDGSLWFCCDAWPDTSASAGLTVYKNQTWKTFTTQDGLPSNNVMNYFRDSQGRQFVATNKGLAQRQGDIWFEPLKEAGFENVETEIWDIAEIPDAGLVVSTRGAFFILKEDTWKRIPVESVYPSQICVTKDGQAISCLQHGELERVFAAWRHDEYVEKSFIFPSLQGGIEEIVEAPDGSIWAIGFNCLVRWDRREAKWKEYLNLPPPCAVDAKGRVWFVGEGFVYVKDQNRWFRVHTSHQDFIQDADKHLWSWTTDEIQDWKTDHPLQFKTEDVGLDLFEQLFSVADNSIWVHGRDEEGHPAFAVYKMGKWEAIPSSRFARHEMLRLRPDAKHGLWALTKNTQDNQIHLFHIQSQSVDELPLNENIQSLALSSNFYDLTIDANHNTWFYGRDLLTVFKSEDNEVRQWDYIPGINGRTVYSVHTRGDEEWISMRGEGLEFSGVAELKEIRIGWRFYPLDVFLFSKMLSDQTIYFSGYGRMFIIPPNWKRVPITLRIPKLGGIHQLVKEGDGTFWIHMDDAIIRYHPDGIPPETFIYNPVQRILEGETLRVECIGKSRYVITESAHQFRFSWQIDDNAWNAFQTIPDEGLPLGGLGPGNHVFRVRAQDEDFEVDPSPVTMEFYVHPSSVLDRPEFQIFLFGIFLLITFLAIYALYARKQLADYAVNLESMVESRAAALKESESRYRELVQNANSIILRMTPKGEITFFNEFAEDFFGYGSDEILSHTIFDTLIPKDKDSKANLDSLLKTIHDSPDQSQYQEMEGMTKEGDRVWIAWTFKQIITENEEKPEILSIGSDITEHKRLEEQLHQAHKMEAVGQLAGGVAHNINNLLTGVIGNLSLVMSEAPESIKESLLAAR